MDWEDPELIVKFPFIVLKFIHRHFITIWSYGAFWMGLMGIATGLLCLLHPGEVKNVIFFGKPVSTPREKLAFAAFGLMFAIVGGVVILVRRSRKKCDPASK